MKRARYGRSSERIEQLELLIGELEADEAEHEAKEPAPAPAKSGSTGSPPRGRQPLPAHLPRERVEHEPACACPACGSTRLSRIGTDERELLEYVPSHFPRASPDARGFADRIGWPSGNRWWSSTSGRS